MGKGLEKEPLNPMWKGLYSVILTTPSALKVAGIDTWIHYSRVKSASLTNSQEKWEITLSPEELLCLTLQRRIQLPQSPALATRKADQSMHGWSLRNQQGWQEVNVLVFNWAGTPPIHLIQNRALLRVSPGVDLYSKLSLCFAYFIILAFWSLLLLQSA